MDDHGGRNESEHGSFVGNNENGDLQCGFWHLRKEARKDWFLPFVVGQCFFEDWIFIDSNMYNS